jgi:hypothetical protein
MSFEDEYVQRRTRKDPIRKFLPALGMILIIAFGAIAWVLQEPLRDLAVEQFPDLPQENEDGYKEVGYIASGVVFGVLVMIGGLMYAAFAPKPGLSVSEKELRQEKTRREAEQRARRKRQRDVRRQMAADRKARSPLDE